MLAIVCCVDRDSVSGAFWAQLFGSEQCALLSPVEPGYEHLLTPDLYPGGLLVVGREPLLRKPVEEADSLEDVMRKLMGGLAAADPTTAAAAAGAASSSGTPVSSSSEREEEKDSVYLGLIERFSAAGAPVCGLGAGAVLLAKHYRFPMTELPEPVLSVDFVGNRCYMSRMLLTRIDSAGDLPEHEGGFSVMRSNVKDVVVFELNDGAGGKRVLGINALPELTPEQILEHLDDVCCSPEAANAAIESLRVANREEKGTSFIWAVLHVAAFLRLKLGGEGEQEEEEEEVEEEEEEDVSQTDDDEDELSRLRLRVAELEAENAQLKFKLKAFVAPLVAASSSTDSAVDADTLKIQSLLLLGRVADEEEEEDGAEPLTEERLQLASALLKPLHSSLNTATTVEEHVNASTVLCMAYTATSSLDNKEEEEVLVWGLANHLVVCAATNEQFKLDAPPVFMTTHGGGGQLAVGTLAGSVYVFDAASNGSVLGNARKLASPHRKHLMGLEFSPLEEKEGGVGMVSLSRDLKLCVWRGEEVVKTLLFDEAQPAECCCSVVVAGRAMVAIAKRNSRALALVPFDDGQGEKDEHEQEQFLCALELGVDETCLAMTRCSSSSSSQQLPVIALVTDRGQVLLVDVRNGGSRLRAFFGGVVCDEYSRPALVWSGNWVACTSNSPHNSILLFAVSNPDHTRPLVLQGEHAASIRALAFGRRTSRARLVLASGSFDKRVLARELVAV